MITRDGLTAVIESNVELQKRARDLNIRNGEDVFHIMPQSELKVWLEERLNGARCIIEIPYLEDLNLPGLDQNLVAKVLADNPDEITVDSVTVPVEYGKDYYSGLYVKVQLEEELVRSTGLEKVTLPGGRDVTIVCGSHSASTFAEVVEKLEKSRIEQAWSQASSEHQTSWVTDLEKIKAELLPKVGSEVEVTKTDNGAGESVIGTIALKCYGSGYADMMLILAKTKEEADEATRRALEVMLKSATKKALVIPQEEPWQKKGSGYYSSWGLTEIGTALQNRFNSLTEATTDDITPANVQEKIDQLKAEVDKIKAEVGGRFVESQKAIEEAEVAVNVKTGAVKYDDQYFVSSELEQVGNLVNQAKEALKSLEYDQVTASLNEAQELADSLEELVKARSAKRTEAEEVRGTVSDDLYNLEYGYEDFAEATGEEREQADQLRRDIDEAFSERRYDEVVEKVEEARTLIETVRSSREDRIAEKRAKYPDALWDAAGNDEQLIEDSINFALSVVEKLGHKTALHVLKNASRVHGKYNQQDVIRNSVPGIEDTEGGETFMNKYYADDIAGMIDCAAAYLESEGIELSEYDVQLAQIEQDRNSYAEDVERAEAAAENGYVVVLQFRKGKHPKTGADQWEAGSSKKGVKYIIDGWSKAEVDSKLKYFCEIKKTIVDTPRFKLIAVDPYLPTFRDFEAEIAALKAEHNVADEADKVRSPDDSESGELNIEALRKSWGSR